MENLVRNLRENLPIITILYYLLCGMTIWLYYSNFKIDILSYCSIKDMLAFPIDALIFIIIIPTYLFGILTLTKGKVFKVGIWFKTRLNNRYFKMALFVSIVLFLVFIGFKAPYTFSYVALLFSIVLICWGLFKYLLYFEKIDYLFVSIGFILFLLISIHIKVDNIKYRNHYFSQSNHISFKYNSESVTTSNDRRWIGQTSEYLFLYDRRSESTEVYKMSEIDSLRFKVDN
jgi:hypothetical protein